MPIIMAFDFGRKRTGIAVTDESQIIASGLTTINTDELFSFLKEFLENEHVVLFIVGKPMQMNYTESESEKFIIPFIERLKKTYANIPIKRVDERFTSKMAFQTMIDGGLTKKQRRNKALIDQISATIILQTYLDQH